MPSHRLLDRTMHLLRHCDLTQPEIAKRAGVGLPWLKKLLQGGIDDPGVKTIQKLHDFLDLYERATRGGSTPGTSPQQSAPAA